MNPQVKIKTKSGENFEVPICGSLGLLALGHVGLNLWRQKRMEGRALDEEQIRKKFGYQKISQNGS